MNAIDRAINGPPADEYEFRGDDGSVMISCRVALVDGVWIARGGDGFVGESDSKAGAAINCFRAWMTLDRSYYATQGMC